jgi:multimeric flavodoxin WrbA
VKNPLKAAVVYWSKTGNTEKVALAIREGLEAAGAEVSLMRTEEAEDIDFYGYDLICLGFPSYRWHPPKPVDRFLKRKFGEYHEQGRVKTRAPKVPGKNALIFCTYSGPHTGINEAIPAGKYAGQFFDHLGLTVLDEWYVVGEYHGSVEKSTLGRLGDIRGRPNADDLRKVRQDAAQLVQLIQAAAAA